MPPKILVISGPTASGKTRLAVELALRHGGEVVSADSMQVYRRMDIGTAKPTPEEMRGVPHHMLDVADPEEDFSVARYVELAAPCVDDILARGKLPIVAGGTGLYLDSLLSGRDLRPLLPRRRSPRPAGGAALTPWRGRPCWGSWPPPTRRPPPASTPTTDKRIVRALEVFQQTGKTISQHNRETRALPLRYDALTLSLAFQRREDMWARIDRRVDEMMAAGLAEEVRALLDSGVPARCTAMQAIGYKEMAAALRGGGDVCAGRGGDQAPLPAVRQAPAHLVPPYRRRPNGSSGDRSLILTAACRTSTEYLEEFGLV